VTKWPARRQASDWPPYLLVFNEAEWQEPRADGKEYEWFGVRPEGRPATGWSAWALAHARWRLARLEFASARGHDWLPVMRENRVARRALVVEECGGTWPPADGEHWTNGPPPDWED
jgi:hypothetical protein